MYQKNYFILAVHYVRKIENPCHLIGNLLLKQNRSNNTVASYFVCLDENLTTLKQKFQNLSFCMLLNLHLYKNSSKMRKISQLKIIFHLNIINGCYGRPSLLPPSWFLTLCSYVPSITLNTTSLWSILKDCHSHGGWRGKILIFSVMFFLLFHTNGNRQKCTLEPRGFLPHE